MKITVITGSPHKKGTSAALADAFIEGAKDQGHQIERFNAAFENVHPCIACDHCIDNGGVCAFADSMLPIRESVLAADLVVLVTPLYYFGMSAHIKMVIDRFYAFNDELLATPKKSMLLATCGDEDSWAMDALKLHYQTICRYLNWDAADLLLAQGVYHREDIEKTDYINQAKRMGKSLIQ